jgi:hypothetical protein
MIANLLTPFIPPLLALIAGAFFWRNLSAPWLFLVCGALALFGIQAIVSFAWEYWPMLSGGHFLEANNQVVGRAVSEAEVQKFFKKRAVLP